MNVNQRIPPVVSSSEKPAISLIIPVYNEVESLPVLLERLETELGRISKPYEIIFIDDGSSDGSLELLKKLCGEHPHLILAVHRANFGKSAGLSTGFSLAQGQFVITIDADLQDEPGEISKLIDALGEGYDVAIGWRVDRGRNDPLSKVIPSRIANFVTRHLSGVPLNDMNSGFKCYRREVIEQISLHSDLHRYIPILAHYRGFRIIEVPVAHHQRQFGHSKYGPERFLRSFIDLLTVIFLSRYRYRPLHFFGLIGMFFGGIGLFINAYLAVLWVAGERPIGDRPLLLLGVLLVIVGFQLALSGLIADLIISLNQSREGNLSLVREIIVSPTNEEANPASVGATDPALARSEHRGL